MLDQSLRNDFPILSTKVNGKPLVYFDNAATSQKPKVVIDKLVEYYSETNANIHRGIHYLANKATTEYIASKKKVADFISAKDWREIIYTRNTTEAMNLIGYSWAMDDLMEGDLILSTEMEHHSSIVSWQLIAKKTKANLEYVPVGSDFSLDMDAYKKLLAKKPKIVTIVHASNVLGTINPIQEMTELAHQVGAIVIIDAAQSAPHMEIDVQKIGCDFLAFSSHKMCGPTGIGVLYGKKEILDKMSPFQGGGEMISEVSFSGSKWNELPFKFEAGTPNIADAIAFGAAIDYLKEVGLDNIHDHVLELTNYGLEKMKTIDGLKIFGIEKDYKDRGSVIAFTMDSAHAHDVAEVLNQEGIAVRSGHHCAQPLHDKFEITATTRASFYLYNTKNEIDKLVDALHTVNDKFK